VLPHEGTSHDGTTGRIVNETMQKMDLFDTEWRLIKIGDRLVQAGSGPRAHLRLVSDGRKVEGFTGCNGMQGHYELASRNVRFVGLATTRKLCPGLMEQERAFLNGLERTRYWKAENGELVLMSEDHEAVLLFKAHTQ
jgi:putative lipoprotein